MYGKPPPLKNNNNHFLFLKTTLAPLSQAYVCKTHHRAADTIQRNSENIENNETTKTMKPTKTTKNIYFCCFRCVLCFRCFWKQRKQRKQRKTCFLLLSLFSLFRCKGRQGHRIAGWCHRLARRISEWTRLSGLFALLMQGQARTSHCRVVPPPCSSHLRRGARR